MKITVVDGQGGKLGKQIVEKLSKAFTEAEITAIGTNSLATSTMLKGGANAAATGENALVVACRNSDIIVGPVGIVIADALMGEITPRMAAAVGASNAFRVLLPVSKCNNYIACASNSTVSEMIDDAVNKITEFFLNA